ncbi:MAG: NAD(P)/FAD-dependent oxidoreductase [Prevotella sp.]
MTSLARSNINSSTLESRQHPGFYFVGEMLDVYAITGGFILQPAWTMGYVVAKM